MLGADSFEQAYNSQAHVSKGNKNGVNFKKQTKRASEDLPSFMMNLSNWNALGKLTHKSLVENNYKQL